MNVGAVAAGAFLQGVEDWKGLPFSEVIKDWPEKDTVWITHVYNENKAPAAIVLELQKKMDYWHPEQHFLDLVKWMIVSTEESDIGLWCNTIRSLFQKHIGLDNNCVIPEKVGLRFLRQLYTVTSEEVAPFLALVPEKLDIAYIFAVVKKDPEIAGAFEGRTKEIPLILSLSPYFQRSTLGLPFGGYTDKLLECIDAWEKLQKDALADLEPYWQACFSECDPEQKVRWKAAMRLIHGPVEHQRDLITYLCRCLDGGEAKEFSEYGFYLMEAHKEYLSVEIEKEATRLFPGCQQVARFCRDKYIHAPCYAVLYHLRRTQAESALPCRALNGNDWLIALTQTLYNEAKKLKAAERKIFEQQLEAFTNIHTEHACYRDLWVRDWLKNGGEPLAPWLFKKTYYNYLGRLELTPEILKEVKNHVADLNPDELWKKHYEGEAPYSWYVHLLRLGKPLAVQMAFATAIAGKVSLTLFELTSLMGTSESPRDLFMFWMQNPSNFAKLVTKSLFSEKTEMDMLEEWLKSLEVGRTPGGSQRSLNTIFTNVRGLFTGYWPQEKRREDFETEEPYLSYLAEPTESPQDFLNARALFLKTSLEQAKTGHYPWLDDPILQHRDGWGTLILPKGCEMKRLANEAGLLAKALASLLFIDTMVVLTCATDRSQIVEWIQNTASAICICFSGCESDQVKNFIVSCGINWPLLAEQLNGYQKNFPDAVPASDEFTKLLYIMSLMTVRLYQPDAANQVDGCVIL